MKQWLIKKGNTSVQDIPVYDKDGALVTNLADASYIKFQVKETRTVATTKIEKTKDDGIAVNTPSLGYLRITLVPTDTNPNPPKKYYMGLEIKWSDAEVYEVIITIDGQKTEVFEIEQDIVLPVAP